MLAAEKVTTQGAGVSTCGNNPNRMQSAATRRGVASSLSMMKTYWAAVGVTIVALASFVTVVTAMATRLTPAVEGKDGGSFSLFKRMMNVNEYGPTNGKPTAAVTSLQKDLVIVFDLIFAKGTLLGQVSDIFMQRSNDLHVRQISCACIVS